MGTIPTAYTFLESVAGYSQDIVKGAQGSAAMPMRLAVVDPAYVASSFPGTLPKVTFEGEDTLSDKRYPVVGNYWPWASDRVVMLPVGSTYVILGGLSTLGSPLRRLDRAPRKFMEGVATIDAVNGQTETATTVSYGGTFATTPKVQITQLDSGGNSYVFKVRSKTTTNFSVGWRKPDNSAFNADATTEIEWFAVGT